MMGRTGGFFSPASCQPLPARYPRCSCVPEVATYLKFILFYISGYVVA